MNYIGSKYRLSDFIKQSVYSVVGKDLSQKVFCDLFAGTGIVGRMFKTEVKQIISNDLEYYSYALNRNYIGNHKTIEYEDLLSTLNDCKGIKGFIFEEYAEGGKANRLYFSSDNGQKIDAVRIQIEEWKNNKTINDEQYYFLLASLLESTDKIANTASVYGAYLKHLKKTAQKKLVIEPALFINTKNKHKVYNTDSNKLIKKISGDILYLDPPYNARQYGANYHLLNTIARYDNFIPQGKTGLRTYNKSEYCSKNKVLESFESLISNAKFEFILLSYNNEGLMSITEIKNIMKQFGDYDLFSKKYQRFKADKEVKRNHKANDTMEFLHVLQKK